MTSSSTSSRPTFRSHWVKSALLAVSLTAPTAFAAVVDLLPPDINLGDTLTASYSDGSLTLTPLQGGVAATFNGGAARLGIDDFGTNANAFNDPDTTAGNANDEQLEMVFSGTSGLTKLSWDFARANGPLATDGIRITGFSADPNATLTGPGTSGLTYDSGSGTLSFQLSNAAFTGTDGVLTLANPGASAGQTLLLTVNDSDQAGAQLPVTGISYEDSISLNAPVITTGLDATYTPVADTTQDLSVVVDPATFPSPTYLWEFDSGGGFVSVGTDPGYSFIAGTGTDGTYRVTVTNSQGSDSSTTVVTSTDDGDGINNQWEIDNFGDHTLYDGTDDVEPDGRTNAQEFADGTDPNDEDTDDDGLTDGEEALAGTNPLSIDSDGDGYGDGYETNTSGTNPLNVSDTPGVDDGRNSIGLTFASSRGLNPGVNLPTTAIAGVPGFRQDNWNVTGNLGNVASITEADVTAPVAGKLVDDTGADSGATFLANVTSTWSTTFNPEQPIGGLLSGYLFVNTGTAEFTVANIPYTRYDVIVHVVDQVGNAGRTYVRDFNTGEEYALGVPSLVPLGTDPVWTACADGSNASTGLNETFPKSTHVIFRGRTGDFNLDLDYINSNIGLAAIQIVEDLDSDGDGMGDFYEDSVGLDKNDNGSTNPLQAPGADFDGDTISNINEHDQGTDPTEKDSDGDGYDDDKETDTGTFVSTTNTGTDPTIADTDLDGLLDGVETGSGSFVSAGNTGTDPLSNGDSDLDGYLDAYEVLNGPTDPFDATAPGGPNPNGFALSFDAVSGSGAAVVFGPLVHAGAPGVEQKNWNRTIDLANNSIDASGDIAKIASPIAGELVDSSGASIGNGATGVGVTFTAGRGAWSSLDAEDIPFGRLYGGFIYGRDNDPPNSPDTTVSFTNIPYSSYDVYVYFGSEVNGRQGTVTDGTTTYSFTTAAANGGTYLQTTDTGGGFPDANYAVFSGQTASTFSVTTTVGAGQTTLGIFGVQVVESTGGVGGLVLDNVSKVGSTFSADFTTDTAGTFQLEFNADLESGWSPIGSSFAAGVGTTPVSDTSAPAGDGYYRVRKLP